MAGVEYVKRETHQAGTMQWPDDGGRVVHSCDQVIPFLLEDIPNASQDGLNLETNYPLLVLFLAENIQLKVDFSN